jgi:hypothetical protein
MMFFPPSVFDATFMDIPSPVVGLLWFYAGEPFVDFVKVDAPVDEHLPSPARALVGPNQPQVLQLVHQSRGAGKANVQSPLDE